MDEMMVSAGPGLLLFASTPAPPAPDATVAALWLSAVDACTTEPLPEARSEVARRSLRAAIQSDTHTVHGAADAAWASRLHLCVLGGAAGRAVICRAAARVWSGRADWKRLAAAARRLADCIDAHEAERDADALLAQMLAAGAP